MTRRNLLATAAGAAAGSSAAQGSARKAIFELRYFRMRNSQDGQMQRTSEFLEKHALPAARRAGVGPFGVFANLIAPDGPFVLLLSSFPSLAALEESAAKMAADQEYQKAALVYYSKPGLSYVRMENSLLRGFDSMPAIEVPPTGEKQASRVFELRIYESDNSMTLRRKMKMFDEGEIGIFRRLGMRPVFFGETIVGRNMPNLTYMLAYDDLAAREKAWRAFGADPEWQKMRVQPGVSDAEIVSNIGNLMLRPLPFSPIR